MRFQQAAYYQANKLACDSRNLKNQEKYTGQRSVAAKKRYIENKEEYRSQRKEYYSNNKGKWTAYEAKRKAAKLQRTPSWSETDQIRGLYEFSRWLTQEYGREIHVDHDYPLQGKLVSGLHVIDNLQLMYAEDNLTKANSFKVA